MQVDKNQACAGRLFGNTETSRLIAVLGLWSIFWVICSDYILSLFVETPPIWWSLESIEGAIYVSVSGAIAGVLIKRIRRESDRARLVNESKLRSIQAAGLIGIFTWRNGTIVDANDAFLAMLGYTRDDLPGGRLRIGDLTAPEYHSAEDEARRELEEKGRSRIFQAELIGKNGVRVVVVGGRARVEGENRYGIGYALDVTALVTAQREQKQLQEQLQRADRLHALGRLAGGIAHDFNNLLGVIVGYTALGQSLGPLDAAQREGAAEVLKAAEKAKHLIRQLLAFSQSHMLHAELLDVNALVGDLEKMLSRILGDTVELRLHLGKEAGCVLADRTQIEQVVVNLVVNARDALPRGGVISITTNKVSVQSVAGREDMALGDYVSICVRDNGVGIDPSVVSQIFEPFFSTKKETGGTGLGLAIVDGVVRQHRGHIRVKSQLGLGTEMTVRFPWAGTSTWAPEPEPAPQIEGGTETILIMEDSEETRRMLAAVLSSLGYKVLTAENGLRGVEVAHQYDREIHLVLADVAMPQMSGPDAVKQIRKERPDIRVLLFTGFADSAVLDDKLVPDVSILEKPIAPEALALKIREVLGPRPPGGDDRPGA